MQIHTVYKFFVERVYRDAKQGANPWEMSRLSPNNVGKGRGY